MADELKNLLAEVQLESFYVKLRDNLQVTRVDHFDDVKPQDLAKIGMSKPAIRRLKKALHERKASAKPGFQKFLNVDVRQSKAADISRPSLACLIADSDLIIGEKLGDGSFGVVKKAQWKKTGQSVAVKILKRDLITSDQILEDFIREVNVMHGLDHKHLIKLHGVCLGPQHMMVTELAPYGALLDYLHVNHSKLLLTTLHLYASQLSCAMAYLESKSFIHRDIALRNIFLLTPEHLKLGDFGLARVLTPESNVYIMAPDRKVPYAWCAPESLKRREFTHAADAWMYAVTLWELYTFGQEPWMGFNGTEILYKIDTQSERLPRPECCPTQMYQMMLQCWLPDPDDRPTFAAVVSFLFESHPTEMRAKQSFSESSDNRKLRLEVDDMVLVIDGRSDKRWWFGQNKRTMAFGYFPRPVLDPLRPLTAADISKPIASTFVHIGAESGHDNPAQMPDQTYVDSPSLTLTRISQDDSKLNPTYLPCRKANLSGVRMQSVVQPQGPVNGQKNGDRSSFFPQQQQQQLLQQKDISKPNYDNNGTSVNPFTVDVFMPELFALPSATPLPPGSVNGHAEPSKFANGSSHLASPAPSALNNNFVASQPRPIPQLVNRGPSQSPSLIDRSTAHYDYLPQPLQPSPDKRATVIGDVQRPFASAQAGLYGDPFFVGQAAREVVAGLTAPRAHGSEHKIVPEPLTESRSRRSAPVDGQIPFFFPNSGTTSQPSQPVLVAPSGVTTAYSPAGDLATQQRLSSSVTFSAMHSQFANLFVGSMRPSLSSSGLSQMQTNAPKFQQQQQNTFSAAPAPVLVPQPSVLGSGLIVRLPPPDPSKNSRKITPPQGVTESSAARASPIDQNASNSRGPNLAANIAYHKNPQVTAGVRPEQTPISAAPPVSSQASNIRHAQPSQQQLQHAPLRPAPTAPTVTTEAVVHKPAQPAAAPLLPGNYRTAKFLEMASLSPARQQQQQQSSQSSSTDNKSKPSSKYTKTEDILPQLKSTLELAQARRQQAEDSDRPQKLRHLVSLGLAPEEICRQLLVKHDWNMEAAGSELAERSLGRR